MGHRAAVYTVRVKRARKRKDKYVPFGDIDGAGTYLGDVLAGYLSADGFQGVSADHTKVVRCESVEQDGDDVRAVMLHGQSGQTADIYDANDVFRIHQEADDTHQIRCNVLFRLPRDQETGLLAAHVNHGRSAFGLLKTALAHEFREAFAAEGLLLAITPFVQGSVLMEAIDRNRLEKVRLVRWEEPDDRAVGATDRWVSAGDRGRIEVEYSAPRQHSRLVPDLIKRYLKGDGSALKDIVEFQGITFDEVKVVVELPNGNRRTFNIQKPDAGHSFTQDLHGLKEDDGEPTPESVFGALGATLAEVSS